LRPDAFSFHYIIRTQPVIYVETVYKLFRLAA